MNDNADSSPPRYTPSQADVTVFKAVTSAPASSFPSVTRWYNHIKSYTSEFDSLPGSSTAGEAFIGTASAAPAAEDEDEEVDLFGSDDEEDAEAERIKAERVAVYHAKKANKPKVAAKVRICLNASAIDISIVYLPYILSNNVVDFWSSVILVRCHFRS